MYYKRGSMFHVAALILSVGLFFYYLARCKGAEGMHNPSSAPRSIGSLASKQPAQKTALNHNSYTELYNFIQDTYALFHVSVVTRDEELDIKRKLKTLETDAEKIIQTFSIVKRSSDSESLFYCLSIVTMNNVRVYVNHAVVSKNLVTREYKVLFSSLESSETISDGILPFQESPMFMNVDPELSIPIRRELLL